MESGESDGIVAARYLLATNEQDIDKIQRFVEARYTVVTRYKAQTNGIRESLDGKPILMWPSESDIQDMSRFGDELAETCPDIKLIDPDWQIDTILARGWGFNQFRDKLYELKRLIFIQTPENFRAQANGGRSGGIQPKSNADAPAARTNAPHSFNAGSPEETSRSDPGERSLDAVPPAPGEPAPLQEADDDEAAQEALGSLRIDAEPLPSGTPWRAADRLPAGQGWPEPLDLSAQGPRGAVFNPGWLPGPLGDATEDIRERMGCDGGIQGIGALMGCAGVADDFLRIAPLRHDHTWLERPCIWGAVVGNASSMKTPGLLSVLRQVESIDVALRERNAHKFLDYKHQMDIHEEVRKQAVRDKGPRPELPPAPEDDQIMCNEGTMEAIRTSLAHSRRGIVVFRDEIGGLIGDMDRYVSAGKGGERYGWMELYNGGRKVVGRANGPIIVDNWSACLVGGITPVTVRQYAGKLSEDGLLQRFMLCCARDAQPGNDRKPDAKALKAYMSVLQNLRDMTASNGAIIGMSEAAMEIRDEFERNLTALISIEDGPLAAHLGKWRGLWPRLALLFHLILLASNNQGPNLQEKISADTAGRVTDLLMRWQLSHLREFWNGIMGDGAATQFSSRIAMYILSHRVERLELNKHVVQPHWRAWKALTPGERKDAIGSLEGAGWIVPDVSARLNQDRFYAVYIVNPAVHQKFTKEALAERQRRKTKAEEINQARSGHMD